MVRSSADLGTRWSPVVLRLGLGIVMLVAGIGKTFGVGPKANAIGEFAGFLASLGVPASTVVAWLVALGEAVAGLLLLVGLFTRYAAAVTAVIMFGATTLANLPNGFAASDGGIEYTLVLFLVAIAIVLSGPGALSLERTVFDDELLVPDDAIPG